MKCQAANRLDMNVLGLVGLNAIHSSQENNNLKSFGETYQSEGKSFLRRTTWIS